MTAFVLSMVALVLAVRFSRVRGLWRLPLRHGQEWFLAQPVPPGFYDGAGAALLRRYRLSLFAPPLVDLPVALFLLVTRRYVLLMCEQWFALIVTIVVYNVMLAHFSARAMAAVAPPEEPAASAVQLSMAPRRLRDHSRRYVELGIGLALLLSLALLAHLYGLAAAAPAGRHLAHSLRAGLVATLWLLYLQAGLLLLKMVFVRWRMPLPARRTEDFRRWRAAWLSHHLRLFDAVRLLCALLLSNMMAVFAFRLPRSRAAMIGLAGAWLAIVVAFTVDSRRQARRLAAVEREIRPVELVKEFPRRPIPEGRFLAGGLLYFNRDNPGVLVRSAQGIAVNLAHPSTYAWVAYFVGLMVLMAWMVR